MAAVAPPDERPRLLIDALTGTRTLLVLDNLETLIDADQRGLLAFLGHLPHTCKAFLTSRPLIIATGGRLKLQQPDQTAALQTLADIARDNPSLDAAPVPDRLLLITETGGNPMLLTWTPWQVGSGYCTTIADTLAHFVTPPPIVQNKTSMSWTMRLDRTRLLANGGLISFSHSEGLSKIRKPCKVLPSQLVQ